MINITRVNETDEKEIIKIAFKTINKEDPKLLKGKQNVETKGVTGSKERVYHLRRENGKLVSKVLVDEKIVTEPINQVVVIGTKPPLNLIDKGKYKEIINTASEKYQISASALYCLMMAESNGNYNSVNQSGPYVGLFQYQQGTWNKYSQKAGYGGADIYDPSAQINVTAWVLKNVGGGSWGPWSGCKNK